MKLRPLGDRVVLKRGEVEEKTASGLFIAGANKEQPQYAEVVAVGPGALVDGKRVPMDVKVGDVVIYGKYGGTSVTVDGEDYLILRGDDIFAIIG